MDGKRMQHLYIYKMVLVEHIIWLREMKKKEKKEKQEKSGFNTHTNNRINWTWHAPNTARKCTVGERTKGTTPIKSWTLISSNTSIRNNSKNSKN